MFIDSTVVNVALPAIEEDLGGGLAGQQWVSNAYLVTLSALILIGGSLGDIFGERRIFSIGVVGFGVTSLLCTIAPTIEVLVIGRALQGVFGALLTPAALAMIVATFDEDERGGAVGSWTAWAGIGTVAGPLIGGQLVDAASWRWIFAINLPLVAIDLVLINRAMPPTRPRPADARVDIPGAVMCALGLAASTFGLIRQPEFGWSDPSVFLTLGGGLLLLVAFIAYEARADHPMLKLSLFRRRNFSVANAETLLVYAGLGVLFFFLTLYLQQVAGYSALEAGTAGLPVTLLMFLLSKRFGALADRHGPRFFMAFGPIVAAVGAAWLLGVGAEVDYLTDLLPSMLLFGLGLSITVAPLTATVLADADVTQRRHRVGREQRHRPGGGPRGGRRRRRGGGGEIRLDARREGSGPSGRAFRRLPTARAGQGAAARGRGESARRARGHRGRLGRGLPPRDRHLGPAGVRRRPAGVRDPEPGAGGQGLRLPGRAAGRASRGRSTRRRAQRRLGRGGGAPNVPDDPYTITRDVRAPGS